MKKQLRMHHILIMVLTVIGLSVGIVAPDADAAIKDRYCNSYSMFKNNKQKTYWLKQPITGEKAGRVQVYKSKWRMANGNWRYCVDFKTLLPTLSKLEPSAAPQLGPYARNYTLQLKTRSYSSPTERTIDTSKYKVTKRTLTGGIRVGTITIEPGKGRCMTIYRASISDPNTLFAPYYKISVNNRLFCNP